MQRRAAEESLTDHGKDNSNGRAHVGDAIRHKPGILGFLRQIGFMGATGPGAGFAAGVAGGIGRSDRDRIVERSPGGLCQVNRVRSEISVNCRWLLYAISMA